MKRSRLFRLLGIIFVLAGILWNVAGTLFGTLSEASALGWVAVFIGVVYLIRSGRARVREEIAAHAHQETPPR